MADGKQVNVKAELSQIGRDAFRDPLGVSFAGRVKDSNPL